MSDVIAKSVIAKDVIARNSFAKYGNIKAVSSCQLIRDEDAVIEEALDIVSRRLRLTKRKKIHHLTQLKRYAIMALSRHQHEVLACFLIDSQERIFLYRELLQGSLEEVVIYPRDVVNFCVENNARGVVFMHHQPHRELSVGNAEMLCMRRIKKAMALFDMKIMDYILVAHGESKSVSESILRD